MEHDHDRRRREAIAYGAMLREQADATTAPSYQVLSASGSDRRDEAAPAVGAYATGRPLPDAELVYERRRQAVARAAAGG